MQARAGIGQHHVPVLPQGVSNCRRPLPCSCDVYWTFNPFSWRLNEKRLCCFLFHHTFWFWKRQECLCSQSLGTCQTWLLGRQNTPASLFYFEMVRMDKIILVVLLEFFCEKSFSLWLLVVLLAVGSGMCSEQPERKTGVGHWLLIAKVC